MMMINASAQTIPRRYVNSANRRRSLPALCVALRWGKTPQSLSDGQRTFMEIYFGPALLLDLQNQIQRHSDLDCDQNAPRHKKTIWRIGYKKPRGLDERERPRRARPAIRPRGWVTC